MYGNRIRELRKEKGMTLRQLSEQLGISFTALGNYERNERQPTYKLIEDIATYFGVTIEYLTGKTQIRTGTRDDDVFLKDFSELSKLLVSAPTEVKNKAVDIYSHIYLLTKRDIKEHNIREMELIFAVLHFIWSLRKDWFVNDHSMNELDTNSLVSTFFKEKQKLDEVIYELFEINARKPKKDLPF